MPRDTAASYEFLAIPMFFLMAEFVLRSGVADDLFRAAAAWFGRIRGGLGIATALAGAGFGAVCGSPTAAAATLASTSLPAMKKYGYETSMASGVVAISGTLSMLIAGVIPGISITFTIALTVYILAVRHPEDAPLTEPVSLRDKITSLRLILPMMVLMMAVTGVIYTGIATPTEASAVGALASAILYFIRRGRETTPRLVYEIFVRAARTSCMLAIIILGAHIFTTFFALTQTTQMIIKWVGALEVNRWLIMVMLIVIILTLGCFMDQMAILVLTVPVLAPLLSSMGFDLIWFGVILIVTAEVGLVTPPMGLNCFVVSKYAGVPVSKLFRGLVPHVIATSSPSPSWSPSRSWRCGCRDMCSNPPQALPPRAPGFIRGARASVSETAMTDRPHPARFGIATLNTRVESWECDFNGHWNARFYGRSFQLAAETIPQPTGIDAPQAPTRYMRFHGELFPDASVEVRSARLVEMDHKGNLMFEDIMRRVALAIHNHVSALGLDKAYMKESGISRMAVESRVTRLANTPVGAPLRVRSRITRRALKSFIVAHLLETHTGAAIAFAEHSLLAVNLNTRRAVELPAFLRL